MCSKKVSVVLVNYFGAEDTALCLESLRASDEPVQVVLVDNSPNDPELEKVLQDYPEVHLINAPENLGFGKGNNLGIDWVLSNTDCEYIFILNNDATVKPDTVTHLIQAMEQHPEAGIVAPRIVFAENPDVLWYGGGEVDWKRGGGRVPGVMGSANAPLAMQARYVSFASGCAMFFRRRVLEQLGGFDPKFFMYDEDLELSLRVSKSGWNIWYEPKTIVHHVGQGSLRKGEGVQFLGAWDPKNPNLAFYVYHIMRNRLITMHKHAKGVNKLYFLLVFPLFMTIKLSRFVLNGRWDAVQAAMKGWKSYRKAVR